MTKPIHSCIHDPLTIISDKETYKCFFKILEIEISPLLVGVNESKKNEWIELA